MGGLERAVERWVMARIGRCRVRWGIPNSHGGEEEERARLDEEGGGWKVTWFGRLRRGERRGGRGFVVVSLGFDG